MEALMVGEESRTWARDVFANELEGVELPDEFVLILMGSESNPNLVQFHSSKDAHHQEIPLLTLGHDEELGFTTVPARFTARTAAGLFIAGFQDAEALQGFMTERLQASLAEEKVCEVAYTYDHAELVKPYTTWNLRRSTGLTVWNQWRSFEQVCTELCKFPGIWV